METIHNLIDSLPKPSSQDISFDNFRRLYKCVPMNDWLNNDILFGTTNYIARKRPELVDLGTRLNVQVNLFLRTIYTYSDIVLHEDDIGCFALTESNAGVLSGLVVEVQFEEKDDHYILNSGAISKKWISQGMFANKGLVFASNKHNHRDCRIFLVDMTTDGITRTQMTLLPTTNALDLTEITYTNVILPKSCVLPKTIPLSRKELLSGIFYGRLCLSEVVFNSLSEFVSFVYNKIKNIDKFKKLPQYPYIIRLNDELDKYCKQMELKRNSLLEKCDVYTINCYKVYCVETSISIYNRIHLLFGTHAFGFGLSYDTLILNKIAEGDTSVLKLAIIKEYHMKHKYVSLRHLIGLMIYDKIGYVLRNADEMFDIIIQSDIPVLQSLK